MQEGFEELAEVEDVVGEVHSCHPKFCSQSFGRLRCLWCRGLLLLLYAAEGTARYPSAAYCSKELAIEDHVPLHEGVDVEVEEEEEGKQVVPL